MSRSLIRTAAGAGAIVAVLLAGGPGVAAASADPDDHGPHTGESRDGHARDARSTGAHRPHGTRPGHESAARDHQQRHRPPGADRRVDSSSEDVIVEPTAVSSRSAIPSSVAARGDVTPAAVPDTATGRTPAPGTTRSHTSDAARAASVPAPATPPVAVVGNGRSPGGPAARRADPPAPAPVTAGTAVEAEPFAASPGPPAAPVPAAPGAQRPWVVAPPAPPAPSFWAPLRRGMPTGALFGLAGLVLAPIAGVWLGYRQARASKAASHLVAN